ncbi:hypothetical protein [Serratia fonticola]
MDKQTESLARQEFEKWFNEQMVLPIIASNETVVRLMWKAWTASREILVVELPEKHFDDGSDKQVCILAGQFNSGIEHSAKAIRAIGIRIKGEGV